MEDFLAMKSGLVLCKSFKKGAKVVANSFEDNATMFQMAFEVGRRYKIMNPQKMRSNYGKLMYMLQDWANPSVARAMGFNASSPILTVHALLEVRARAASIPLHPTARSSGCTCTK